MQLLIDQLDVNSCAGDIQEYLARFSFWQDAHEDMSEKAAKGAFLTVIGGPAFRDRERGEHKEKKKKDRDENL